MADIYDEISLFLISGSHKQLKLVAKFVILRRLNKCLDRLILISKGASGPFKCYVMQ